MVDIFWPLITLIGEPVMWAVLCGIIGFSYLALKDTMLPGRRKKVKAAAILIIISFAAVTSSVMALKFLTGIQRPCTPCPSAGCNPYCLSDHSFPSGHAAISFAVFTSIIIVSGRRRHLFLMTVPVLVSVSRIMLSVHFSIDVLVGGAIGLAAPAVIWYLAGKRIS